MARQQFVCTSYPQVAELFGVQPQTVRAEWRAWLPEKPPGGWLVKDLIALVRARDAKRHERQTDESDPLLASGSSPALEMYREEKAKLARMDREEREKSICKRDEVHEVISEVARLVRGAGEDLQRRFGPDAQDVLNQALDEADRYIEGRFGNDDDPQQLTALSGV